MISGFIVTRRRLQIWVVILLIVFIVEMCLVPKTLLDRIKRRHRHDHSVPHSDTPVEYSPDRVPDGFSVGTYYSNWSPYDARDFKPADLPVESLTHVYYAFFVVDPKTGSVRSSDTWSDFEMPLGSGVKGCIKDLQRIKLSSKQQFRSILCLGGWSNRKAFKTIAGSQKKVDKFVESAVEAMFEYGFDGIDLDWEFPEEDTEEPYVYLEMMRGIRREMNKLEEEIFGSDGELSKRHPHFQLSVATPAFDEKLNILPIKEMSKYVDIWNMMCYDFNGEWSEVTGYHSNLYTSHHIHKRHYDLRASDQSLSADNAVKIMIKDYGILPRKISLGMAAYGRGFTNVDITTGSSYTGRKFKGVGGASEGESGIWRYNQLPIAGANEEFDEAAVSAYCFDFKTKTFVGYDNVLSSTIKGKYIKDLNLNGGFWWEACGDSTDPKRSLLAAFRKEVDPSDGYVSMFKDQRVKLHHLHRYPNSYISPLLR